MKVHFTFKNILYRSEQVMIVVAHLILLKWIFYCLYEGGTMPVSKLMLHFTGMAIFGALLIRGTAYLVQRRYMRDNNLTHIPK
ncbi:MAG: hypothetical protein ACOYL6_07120 [Bacteriovoracaceae bacterium]